MYPILSIKHFNIFAQFCVTLFWYLKNREGIALLAHTVEINWQKKMTRELETVTSLQILNGSVL